MTAEYAERRVEIDEIEKNNIAKYREVVNRILSSEDGKYFYKALAVYCGLFSVDKGKDDASLRESLGKRKVILEMILPFIDKDVRRGLHD